MFPCKEKTCLQSLWFQIQTEPLPTLPFPWTTLCLLCSTVSCSSFSPHGREDKPGGVCIPGPIQQRGQRRPSPSRPPPSLRQKSRGGLRRVRHAPPTPAWFTETITAMGQSLASQLNSLSVSQAQAVLSPAPEQGCLTPKPCSCYPNDKPTRGHRS